MTIPSRRRRRLATARSRCCRTCCRSTRCRGGCIASRAARQPLVRNTLDPRRAARLPADRHARGGAARSRTPTRRSTRSSRARCAPTRAPIAGGADDLVSPGRWHGEPAAGRSSAGQLLQAKGIALHAGGAARGRGRGRALRRRRFRLPLPRAVQLSPHPHAAGRAAARDALRAGRALQRECRHGTRRSRDCSRATSASSASSTPRSARWPGAGGRAVRRQHRDRVRGRDQPAARARRRRAQHVAEGVGTRVRAGARNSAASTWARP